MEIEERLIRLQEHVKEHPKDYQAVIAEMKAYSDLVEHRAHTAMIERIKRVAEIKRKRAEYAKLHE